MHTQSDDTRRLLTIAQAAQAMSVSRRSIWRLLSAGELQQVNVGRAVRIPVRSIEAFIAKGGAR